MEEVQILVPAMYADHHVLEVRRILLDIPGVVDVYASSCYQTVKVIFDPAQTGKKEMSAVLDAAGYVQPLQIPVEAGAPAYGNTRGDPYFRHTAAHEQTRHVIQFTQRVTFSGRPLWPCPGMGVITREKDVNDD